MIESQSSQGFDCSFTEVRTASPVMPEILPFENDFEENLTLLSSEEHPDQKLEKVQSTMQEPISYPEIQSDKLQAVTHISVLPRNVLGDIFSFLPPQQGAQVCCACKLWKEVWQETRYQEPVFSIRNFKKKVCGRTLIQCFEDFSPELFEKVNYDERGFHHLDKTVRMMNSVVRYALLFLTPEERKEIETFCIPPQPLQTFSWDWFVSFVPWIYKKEELTRIKREIWQITENPPLLKKLFEKAFRNRDLYNFFRRKVECEDYPPWKKVVKIREWLNTSASTAHSLGPFDSALTQVPVEIGMCTGVEAIDVSNNRITSLPSELGSLTKLQSLSLGGNRLTSFIENCSTLRDLKALYLEHNSLENLPEGMKNLQLLTLDISFNPMTKFPEVIRKMNSLRLLRLSKEQKDLFGDHLLELRKINPPLRVEVIKAV